VVLGLYALGHYALLITVADVIVDIVLLEAAAAFLIWACLAIITRFFKDAGIVKTAKRAIIKKRRAEGNLLTTAVSWLSFPLVVATNFYLRYLDPIFKDIGKI